MPVVCFAELVLPSLWAIWAEQHARKEQNVKFMFLRRPQNLMKSSPSICRYVVSAKLTVKISSIFVAFLENMDFTKAKE